MKRFGDPIRWMLGGLLLMAGVLYFFLPRPDADVALAPDGTPKTVITVIGGSLERDRQMWHAIEAGFERDHPALDLKVMRGGGTQRKVDTMIAGGVAPDVIEVNADNIRQYVESGALLDLGPLIADDVELLRDITGTIDDQGRPHPPDYFDFTIDAFRAEDSLYALPVWYINFFVYYNKTLFDKYNVPYPDEDWDWQGFRERAIALTRDRTGRPVRIPRRDHLGRPVTDERGYVIYEDNPAAEDQPFDFGLSFAWWQHGPESFIAQNRGSLIADKGTPDERLEIDNRARDAMWFLYETSIVNRTQPNRYLAASASQDIQFKGGHVGMMGPMGVFLLIDAREQWTDFEWDVAPLPVGPDGTRASLVQPIGMAISSQCRHPQAAYAFVRWFSGPRGSAVLSRWPLFIPPRRSVALSEEHFLDPSTKPDADWAMVHDVSFPYTDPLSGNTQIGYAELPAAASVRALDVYDAINNGLADLFLYGNFTRDQFEAFEAEHGRPPTEQESLELHRDALNTAIATINDYAERAYRWARHHDPDREARSSPWQMWLPLVLILGGGITLIFWRARRRHYHVGPLERSQERWGYLLISPWLIGFICLTAGPILFSIGLSLCKWQSLGSLADAEFVGVENYIRALRGDDPLFYKSLKATLQYSLLSVPLLVVGGLGLALLMNSKIPGINFWRTFYFVPSILPVVAVVVLYFYLFDPHQGWVNHVLRGFGWQDPPAWLTSDEPVLGIPAPMWMFVLMSLWTVGGTMIIYLGSLQGIPTQLYEAAEVDGAGMLRKFRHVTLPMISPVLFFMLIMGIISSFQVFTNAYVLFESGGGPRDSTLFYVLHLFNEAVNRYRFGYGAALAWILFAMILVLTALVFKSSPMWVYYEGQRERRAQPATPPAPKGGQA